MSPDSVILFQRFLRQFEDHWKIALDELDAPANGQFAGGNRLRPQMCLLGYLASVEPALWNTDDLLLIADISVSIELLHKASLVLDDWIDHDPERRGQPTLHMQIGPECSALFAIKTVAFSMQRLKKRFTSGIILPQHYYLCLDALIETTYLMASGAYRELSVNEGHIIDYETAREITQLETSTILGNGLLLGYYVSIGELRNAKVESEFKWIGDQCGYIFQAMNDLEAFYSPNKLIQHKGNLNLDITSHRKNLAIALLYQIVDKKDKTPLFNADKGTLISLMQRYRIFDFFKHDIELEYAALVERIDVVKNNGISAEWCALFREFLGTVKKFAEERL